MYKTYLRIRVGAEKVPIIGSCVRFAAALKRTALDSSFRDLRELEKLYRSHVDPYGFRRQAEELRFRRAEQMLDSVRHEHLFDRAFEIGCAEGMFSEKLAVRCNVLIAVDLSFTALARAKERCGHASNVEFEQWDLRKDLPPGKFDLIVAAGVLEYIYRPWVLRRVREYLVQSLRPGGYLLVGNTVAEGAEDVWWGRCLLRGTWINNFISRHPQLETVSKATDQCACPFAHVLLRKSPDTGAAITVALRGAQVELSLSGKARLL